MIIIHIIDDFLFNLFILSLTHAFQFRDLFGYDMSPLFKATAPQMKTAKEFYADYLKYQKNDRAIEAHELIRKWAKVLKVDSYFSLVEESEYRNNPLNPPLAKGEVIASEANDLSSSVSFPLVGNRSDSPLIKGDRGLFKKDSGQANSRLDVAAGVTDAGTPPIPTLAKANSRCLKQGQGGFEQSNPSPLAGEGKGEGEPAGQMAVTMYCLSALQYFEDKELPEIQKVGFEIAMLGRQGIDPAKTEKKYHLDNIPGKEFSGLQLLAYMYAAFQVIDPFLDTGLAFKKEYEEAKKLHEKR